MKPSSTSNTLKDSSAIADFRRRKTPTGRYGTNKGVLQEADKSINIICNRESGS